MKVDLEKVIKNKELTKLEQQVLEYIINNIDSVIKLGVRGVAKENFTSTSTVMRLAKKLGYDGFVEMVYNIMPLIKREVIPVSDEVSPMDGVSLDILLKYIPDSNIKEFVELLLGIKNKVIFVYATGFSKLIAEYLSKKLLIIGKKSIFSSGGDSVGIFENHLDDMETLIVISKSGETNVVLDKVNTAKNKGIKVISITKEIENSIAKASDINFKILDINKLDDRNYYPNTFFPNSCMLVEYLIFRYFQELNRRK
jgi:DNA-binding MurR/RpiR family transcriptional regulator